MSEKQETIQANQGQSKAKQQVQKTQARQQQGGQVSAQQSFTKVLEKEIGNQFKAVQNIVPKHVTPERLIRVALQAMSRNPELFNCEKDTIVGAIMNCASLGLEPNLMGHAYIVPFYNSKNKRMEAQFQIGYKGLLDLVRRTGEVSNIYAHEVYEHDYFSYEYGLHKDLQHKPAPLGEDRGKPIAFYAVYKLKDGGSDFLVMSNKEILAHKEHYSKAGSSQYSPWNTAYEEMAKKTVLRRLIKYMPISIEQQDTMERIETDEKIMKLKKNQFREGEKVLAPEYVPAVEGEEANENS